MYIPQISAPPITNHPLLNHASFVNHTNSSFTWLYMSFGKASLALQVQQKFMSFGEQKYRKLLLCQGAETNLFEPRKNDFV